MLSRKRFAALLVSMVVIAAVGGVMIYFNFFYGKDNGFFTSSHIRFHAYFNDDADTKMNASNKTFVEFSPSDYAKVASNETDNTMYVSMRADEDDWDGMHFVFDLSGYDVERLASIRFTWIGKIMSPGVENLSAICDCMELWYYKDSGWVKFDDINQSVWMTKTGNWTSSLADYIDAVGKVHFSVVIHVERAESIDSGTANLQTQFVNLEVSSLS